MLVLIEEQIRPLLRWDDLIPTMESALAAFSEGRVIQPVRNMITIEEGRRYLGVMPAVAEAAMGLKLVSFYPGNAPSLSPSRNALTTCGRQDKLGHQTATITIPGRDFLGGGGMIECEVPPRQESNAMRFDGESRVGSYHSGRDPTN